MREVSQTGDDSIFTHRATTRVAKERVGVSQLDSVRKEKNDRRQTIKPKCHTGV